MPEPRIHRRHGWITFCSGRFRAGRLEIAEGCTGKPGTGNVHAGSGSQVNTLDETSLLTRIALHKLHDSPECSCFYHPLRTLQSNRTNVESVKLTMACRTQCTSRIRTFSLDPSSPCPPTKCISGASI